MSDSDNSNLKRTPLYEAHVALNGKIVPFAGWELPVQYSGLIQEHNAVRTKAGIFDVSHMGEITVKGSEAEKYLQYLTCNDVSTLENGKAQYSALLNEEGGVIDDIIIYRKNAHDYLVCVNASNADKDFDWIKKNNKFDCEVLNVSNSFGQIALQGPEAVNLFEKVFNVNISDLKYFYFKELNLLNVSVIVARTGYTGEDGVELFVPAESTRKIWDKLTENSNITPCGLGARDSLRLEAAYPLHGHELGEDIISLESGLGWITKFKKGDFIGSKALLNAKENGLKRSLIGFEITDQGIARHGDKVENSSGEEIGFITSGTKTPTVNKSIGLALVNKAETEIGKNISLVVRGRKLNGKIIKTPFYSSLKK